MSRAASSVKKLHYAEREPLRGEKSVPTLCGFRLPVKDTTTDTDKVTCFMCFERLQK